MSSNNPFQNAKAGVETVVADAAKVVPTVKADVAKAQAAIVKADNWLAAFIKNNAGKISTAVLAALGAAIWHYLF